MLYYIGAGAVAIVFIIVWYLIRRKKIDALIKKIDELSEKDRALKKEIETNQREYDGLTKKLEEVKSQIDHLDTQRVVSIQRAREAKESTDRLLASEVQRAKSELNRIKEVEYERMQNEFKEKERTLEQQFDFKKKQFTEDFEILLEVYNDEVNIAKSEVSDFQAKREAINQAIAREKELQENEAFYSIDVSKNDQEDITLLQSMDLRLHNRDVIPKLVWELFIRRPTTEMIKRVTGGKKIGGIYKITFKKTGESYIGKTVDFATRWQNHVKTAIGLDGAARATLHNRMAKDGLWNYTFEILEEVDKDHLSARESYYIDLYGTKSQLNMKAGEKQ